MSTGFDEFVEACRHVAEEFPRQVSTPMIRAGLREFGSAYRRAAPRKTGAMARSVGHRVDRRRGSGVSGKAGYGVGKKKRNSKYTREQLLSGQAPHSHLYVHGTTERKRKRIGGKFSYLEQNPGPNIEHQRRTGKSPAHYGIASTVSGAVGDAMLAMVNAGQKSLADLAEKHGK